MIHSKGIPCAAVIAIAAVSSALAQTAATPSNEASSTLEAIVVTAQRRSENMQNVPITVSTFSGAALERAGVTNILELPTVAAGLQVSDNNSAPAFHIRGVGTTSPGPTIEPPIALYVDGVYYAATQGSRLDLVDVSDIEVLKGPQGTLFGRNATGGLVQITTKAPSHTARMDVELGYGNYGASKGSLYVTDGLTDTVAASLSLQISHQENGYGHNLSNSTDVNRQDINGTVRPKFLWEPTDGTKVTLIADFSKNKNNFDALRIYPGTFPGPPTGPNYGGKPWDTDSDIQPSVWINSGGTSVRLDQDLSFAHLMDIAAYRETKARIVFDVDTTKTPLEWADVPQEEHQYSEELQLQSLPSSLVTWTTGLYYFNEAGGATPLRIHLSGGPLLNPNFPIDTIQEFGWQKVESVAAYGQATMEILPATHLTMGARYTYERHNISGMETLNIGDIPIVPLANPDESTSYQRPTYRISLDHRFSESLLAFVSFNTGFKSGGFDPYVISAPAYAPETVDAYEAGVKTDLLDQRLRVNASGFYYEYKNIQVQNLENGTNEIINGARARIYGVDVDAQAKVSSALSLQGGVSYLNSRFISFPSAPISSPSGLFPVVSGPANGNATTFSPTWLVVLGPDYAVRTATGGSIDLSISYQYNSGYYLEVDNVIKQPAFSEFNTSIKWTSENSRYTASLWGNNLGNKAVVDQLATEAFGTHTALFAPPRTYGVAVSYHY